MAEQIVRPDKPYESKSRDLVEHMQAHGYDVRLVKSEECSTPEGKAA